MINRDMTTSHFRTDSVTILGHLCKEGKPVTSMVGSAPEEMTAVKVIKIQSKQGVVTNK